MEIHFKIIGGILILLALAHGIFPRYFNWKQELSALSLVNRQIMYVHSFFIALMVFLIGVLCLTSSGELLSTALGKRISLGIGLFWGVRLVMQFAGYSSKIWKGKTFETAMHILFSVFWTYLTAIFIRAYMI
jgi:hypothetical protein